MSEKFNLSELRHICKNREDNLVHAVYDERDIRRFIKKETSLFSLFFKGLITYGQFKSIRNKLMGDNFA